MGDWQDTDLFGLGAAAFEEFKAELLEHGIDIDPDLELRRASGLLCYYSVTDHQIYLSVPEWEPTSIAIFQMVIGSLFDATDEAALLRFLKLFIPRIIAHEIGHHLRHRRGLFDQENLWLEEQIANELAVALTKRRWSPADREFCAAFIRRAIDSLASKFEQKTIANDSYNDVLEALYAEGRLGTRTVMTIRAVGELFDVEPLDVLEKAGVVPADVVERLEGRDDLITDFNATYTNDQLTYMYYQMGWLQVDLTSRETGYIDEFGRVRLGIEPELLPRVPRDYKTSTGQVMACYRAHQKAFQAGSHVASNYFYKRYRTELLERLQKANLGVPLQSEALRRNGDFLLESWEAGQTDRLELLAPLVPVQLRRLLPSRVDEVVQEDLNVEALLTYDTDLRLYAHVCGRQDPAAASTLQRLEYLESSELFEALPAELLMDVAHSMFDVWLSRDEVIIWQGEHQNDVYVPVSGGLRYEVRDAEGEIVKSESIPVGQVFGEMSFLGDQVRSATVVASEPSRLLVVKGADLNVLIHEHPAIMKRLAAVMVRRLSTLMAASGQV